jgi:hypothetical protein
VDYTNNTLVIRQLDHMFAINSAIQVDLTGQVCAESIGTHLSSGVGGQMEGRLSQNADARLSLYLQQRKRLAMARQILLMACSRRLMARSHVSFRFLELVQQ